MAQEAETTGLVANRRQLALIGGGALALAVLLFLAWYLVLRTPMAPAFVDLKAEDASLIVDELERQKISYELADDGATVLVPRDQVDATRVAILGRNLPLKGTVGFELFSKSDMGLTEFAQKINYQRALQGELARTLMSLSNVDTARVHITLPEAGVFRDDNRPAKASVTLTPKPGAVVDVRTTVGIQRLVASAVEGLDAANVVVLDSAGKQLSADYAGLEAEAEPSGSEIEQAYAERIRDVAAQLVDDPRIRVTVHAPPDAAIATSGSAEDGSASLARRSFPLRITIALAAEPGPELQEDLKALLESSIGYAPANGDSLRLIRLPQLQPYQVPSPTPISAGLPQDRQSAQADGASSSSWFWLIACLLFAVAAAMALGRVTRRRPMTAAHRASFASRLNQLLEEDERLRSDRV